MADVVRKIVRAGIPVMGHIGLTPQRFLRIGGFRVLGKSKHEEEQLLRDAEVLEEAGIFFFGYRKHLCRRSKEDY